MICAVGVGNLKADRTALEQGGQDIETIRNAQNDEVALPVSTRIMPGCKCSGPSYRVEFGRICPWFFVWASRAHSLEGHERDLAALYTRDVSTNLSAESDLLLRVNEREEYAEL